MDVMMMMMMAMQIKEFWQLLTAQVLLQHFLA